MSIEILSSGVLTTVQDLGRFGFGNRGINPNGVMDWFATRAANSLLGNPSESAILEMHFPAPHILFRQAALICLAGAEFTALLALPAGLEKPLECFRPYQVPAGSTLRFDAPVRGRRVVLAVHGGWSVPPWMGSRSTHLMAGIGGNQGRALKKGDQIPFSPATNGFRVFAWKAAPSLIEKVYLRDSLRVLAGPEWNSLSRPSQEDFLKEPFSITPQSGRTAYLLDGPVLQKDDLAMGELLSSGVAFGTVQLLPNGQLLIFMADHPVTGGYPRIANVIQADLPYLAQNGPPAKLRFKFASQSEAEMLYVSLQRDLQQLANSSAQRINEWLSKQSI